MTADLILTPEEITVRFGPVDQHFPKTALGLMRAVAYAMTFGRPVTFWLGNQPLRNMSAFVHATEGA